MLSGGSGGGCSRLSIHLRLRDSDINRLHLNLHHPLLGFGFGFGFVFVLGLGSYNTRTAHVHCCPSPPPLKPLSLSSALSHSHSHAHTHTRGIPFSSILPSSKSSSSNITALSHRFRVVVDTGYVHIEMDDEVDGGVCKRVDTRDLRLLRIEFGDSQS